MAQTGGTRGPESLATRSADVSRDPARTLRENIRSLVEKRKAGQRGDPSVLNRFLSAAPSHPRLVWDRTRSLQIEKIRRTNSAPAILAPWLRLLLTFSRQPILSL